MDDPPFSTPELTEAQRFQAAQWDARLQALWDARLSLALQAAEELYALDSNGEPSYHVSVEERVTALFWRTLASQESHPPETSEGRYQAVVAVVWRVLRALRNSPDEPFVEEYLAVALRPVRKLWAGALVGEVCAILHDYHRGIWTPHLTKPQLYVIRVALAKTIAALPPDELGAFWENLQSTETMRRNAMLLGLEFLRSYHAVPHLVRGLEQSQDHAARAAILNCLEEIADPRAIAPLMRLRRETAFSDWTLSRQIGRVLRVIEQQNRGNSHRTLLRAATSFDEAMTLLRPPRETPACPEVAELLRPIQADRKTNDDS